jgi:glutamate dehydrogenase
LIELNAGIDALDGILPGALQLRLYSDLQDLLMSRIVWFIRNVDLKAGSLDAVVGTYRTGIAQVEGCLDGVLSATALAAWEARTAALTAGGVPVDLARRLAALPDLIAAPDIVLVAGRTGRGVLDIARTHFALEALFQLGTLIGAAREIVTTDYYDRLALDRAIDTVAVAHRNLTAEAATEGGSGGDAVAAWNGRRGGDAERIRAAVDGIMASGLTLSKVTVAASLLVDLAKGRPEASSPCGWGKVEPRQ